MEQEAKDNLVAAYILYCLAVFVWLAYYYKP